MSKYKKSNIFLSFHCVGELTNRVEAFGVTIIEAMSYALPVVTGNVGGPSEIIIDKENGFLVNQMDFDRYVSILTQLCTDKLMREKIGKNAASYVQEKFSISNERSRILEILMY